jgi:hypothetical protein
MRRDPRPHDLMSRVNLVRKGENIMHRLLIASTVLAGLIALPAFAAPMSTTASNIDRSDTRSTIAPQLPAPPVGDDGSARALLQAASQALSSNQTGMAQESLERAETRLLTRSTEVDQASSPDNSSAVNAITSARMAIAHGDLQGANGDVQQALAALPQNQASTVP